MSQKAFDYIPLAAPPCVADDASVCCGAGALAGGLDAVAGESMLAESESMMLVVLAASRVVGATSDGWDEVKLHATLGGSLQDDKQSY